MGKGLSGYDLLPRSAIRNRAEATTGNRKLRRSASRSGKEIVPLCEKLYEAQAKRIGVDRVMAYDEKFVFPDGNAEPIGDEAFMVAEAQKMYHDISPGNR